MNISHYPLVIHYYISVIIITDQTTAYHWIENQPITIGKFFQSFWSFISKFSYQTANLTQLGLGWHIFIVRSSSHFPSNAYMHHKSSYFCYRLTEDQENSVRTRWVNTYLDGMLPPILSHIHTCGCRHRGMPYWIPLAEILLLKVHTTEHYCSEKANPSTTKAPTIWPPSNLQGFVSISMG